MRSRNILALASAALMLSAPLAANATTTSAKPSATPASHSCKGLTGKALKDCNAKQVHTKTTTKPKS